MQRPATQVDPLLQVPVAHLPPQPSSAPHVVQVGVQPVSAGGVPVSAGAMIPVSSGGATAVSMPGPLSTGSLSTAAPLSPTGASSTAASTSPMPLSSMGSASKIGSTSSNAVSSRNSPVSRAGRGSSFAATAHELHAIAIDATRARRPTTP